MNNNETELDTWKEVAKKLNLALIHCFSWINCNQCFGTKPCEQCLAQFNMMEDAIKEYYKKLAVDATKEYYKLKNYD